MDEIDQLWSKIVRTRVKNKCEVCGGEGVHAHHIRTRSAKSTRWKLANGCCLCHYCHKWAHEKPLEFKELIVGKMGEGSYNALNLEANKPKKIDKKEKLKRLKIILRQYEKYL